jgi:hypothetical protein
MPCSADTRVHSRVDLVRHCSAASAQSAWADIMYYNSDGLRSAACGIRRGVGLGACARHRHQVRRHLIQCRRCEGDRQPNAQPGAAPCVRADHRWRTALPAGMSTT